jgi:predicted nucleic acid-binding protein
MDIVIDVSGILAVLLNEPERPAIELATMGHHLISPGCVRWEVGNALYGAIKRDRIKVQEALSAFEDYERIPIRQVDVDMGAALRIAARHKIPTYDACYLECARAQRTALLTLDDRMMKVAATLKINVVEVIS